MWRFTGKEDLSANTLWFVACKSTSNCAISTPSWTAFTPGMPQDCCPRRSPNNCSKQAFRRSFRLERGLISEGTDDAQIAKTPRNEDEGSDSRLNIEIPPCTEHGGFESGRSGKNSKRVRWIAGQFPVGEGIDLVFVVEGLSR